MLRFFILLITLAFSQATLAQPEPAAHLKIGFQNGTYVFTNAEKKAITDVIEATERDVRLLLPSLPEMIDFTVEIIDRNLDIVSGVAGWSQAHSPKGDIHLLLSNAYPGGVEGAARAGLAPAVYHELHHLARGWTLDGNKYGPGISTAAVNEGLAVVFAEEYTGIRDEGNSYPEEADSWVREILTLPKDADYTQWVSGEHPDGRTFIGYRAGNYLVRKALERSGKNILEISKMTPEAILALAGYEVPEAATSEPRN